MTAICLGLVEGAMRFQLSGRPAAADIRVMRSMCSALNRPTAGMNSREVPSKSRHTRASSTISSSLAWREGTGLPPASLWVVAQLELKPRPPASMDSASRAFMAASSSGVAWLPIERSPIARRRMALWPTMKPALTARVPSSWSSHSP